MAYKVSDFDKNMLSGALREIVKELEGNGEIDLHFHYLIHKIETLKKQREEMK